MSLYGARLDRVAIANAKQHIFTGYNYLLDSLPTYIMYNIIIIILVRNEQTS